MHVFQHLGATIWLSILVDRYENPTGYFTGFKILKKYFLHFSVKELIFTKVAGPKPTTLVKYDNFSSSNFDYLFGVMICLNLIELLISLLN